MMKKLIYSLAFIGVIASCKSKTESAAEVAYQDSLRKVAIIDSMMQKLKQRRVEAEKSKSIRFWSF